MNFDNLIGDKPDIHDVLSELEDKKIISDWSYYGDHPTCEEEFNERFTKIIPNEKGWGVKVNDPSKFGITYQEVMSHYDDIMKEFNAIKQARKRKYPKVEEQLDMIWHTINSNLILKILFGKTKWFTTIKSIKSKKS
jgi:hypothetical protein